MKMEIINVIIKLAREAERNKVILEHNLAVNTAFKNPVVNTPEDLHGDLPPHKKDEEYVVYAEGEFECVCSLDDARNYIKTACFDGSEWSLYTDHAFIAKIVETVSLYKDDVRENHPCPHGRAYCDELCEKELAEKCEDSNPWYSEHNCSYNIEFKKV